MNASSIQRSPSATRAPALTARPSRHGQYLLVSVALRLASEPEAKRLDCRPSDPVDEEPTWEDAEWR
jgi:hypothetical protein